MADELNGAAPAAAESTLSPTSDAPASMPAADATTPAPSFDESLKANAEKIWARNNPPREAGRFAPRNPEAAPDTSVTAASEQPTPDQPRTEGTEPAAPAIDAPQSWSAEMKAKFAALPPEVRAYVADRDKDAFRQISRMGEQVKAIEPVKAIVEQESDYLRQVGRTPHEAVQQLFAVSHALDRDPASAIGWLARHYGVDLQAVAAGTQQQPSRVQNDPQLVQAVRELQAETRARQQAEQAEKLRSITQTIETFAKNTKEHPYFEDLESEIEAQVVVLQKSHPHLSPQELLAAAYNKAKWAHDPVRERILADQRKADEDKRKAEQEKQVKEARRQAPFTQKPGIGNSHAKESFEDTLRRNVQRVMGT